jgi:hypothetical protein
MEDRPLPLFFIVAGNRNSLFGAMLIPLCRIKHGHLFYAHENDNPASHHGREFCDKIKTLGHCFLSDFCGKLG